MNVSVAVQTGAGEHLVRRRRSLEGFKTGVGPAHMSGRIMAVPAELGNAHGQEFVMVAAVRHMARRAVFIDGGMGPHKRPALFGVALVTEFVYRLRLDQRRAEAAVVFVAIRALQFSFADGMVRDLIHLGPNALVAEIAEVRLRGLQVLPGSGMHGMAVVAGDPLDPVPGHVPEGEVPLRVVAVQAFGGFRLAGREFFAEDENADAPFPALFDVRGARAVAGLAAFLIRRASRDAFFGMGRHQVRFVVILMAALADLHAHRAVASRRLAGEKPGTEEEKNGEQAWTEDESPHGTSLFERRTPAGAGGERLPRRASVTQIFIFESLAREGTNKSVCLVTTWWYNVSRKNICRDKKFLSQASATPESSIIIPLEQRSFNVVVMAGRERLVS